MLKLLLKIFLQSCGFWCSFHLSEQVPQAATMASQAISSATSYKNPKLIGINDVEIDKSGKFKYILIKVHDPDKDREFKFIVRGTSKAGYHGEYQDFSKLIINSVIKIWLIF